MNMRVIAIALIFTLIRRLCAQEGFTSIQCCAASNFTDQGTNLTWISDNHLFRSVGRCKNFSVSSGSSDHKFSRVFDESDSKSLCYNLHVIKSQKYLVRATFLNGHSPQFLTGTTFDFSIGSTSISQINSSVEYLEVESIYAATNGHTDFCLRSEDGNSYISKLELRPLNDDYYIQDPSTILKLVTRVDLGNKNLNYRFPEDLADRIWHVDYKESGFIGGKILESPDITLHGSNVSVPLEVLHTAITDDERLIFNPKVPVTGHDDLLIILYFLDLDVNVRTRQRVFDIYVNGHKKLANFDILDNENSSNYKVVTIQVKSNGFLNISLVKVQEASKYGPICNAYEIYQVLQRSAETIQRDVVAVMKLKQELMVENSKHEVFRNWQGDPCYPTSWFGVSCEEKNGSFVITKINLPSMNLQGVVPSAIGDLAELTELDVQNNNFVGSIPKSLASLPDLLKLSIECNPQLSSQIPYSLSTRKNLTISSGRCDAPTLQKSNIRVMGGVAGASVAATFALGIICSCFYKRPRRTLKRSYPVTKTLGSVDPSIQCALKNPGSEVKTFTLEYIKKATCCCQTLIGEGGFGPVYRGTLSLGQEVAVKVRSATSVQGTREFDNEVNLLSKLQHENLVPLLGYCCENDQQILVYPFMSNGSLQERLYGEASKRKVLDWPTRLSIALGAARGLLYLHTFPGRCIIHRDVKSSNILLDHSMCGKVADFGFSKYAPQEGDSGASLEVRGTAGYLDPEYYSTQQLSTKSDVFSFGVVLLEIVTGREPLNLQRPRSEWSLVEWAKAYIRDQRIDEIVDPSIKGGYHAEAMWRVVEAALACIEPFSAYRPNIVDIVRELEDALIIENNASEYMRSIESFGGGSNRFQYSIDRKIPPALPMASNDSSSAFSQIIPPQPR